MFLTASLIFVFERREGGPIDDYGTALWWAIVTITTVGYGDAVPITNEGRGIAAFLMIVGISLFGFLTANIASFLVALDQGEARTDLDKIAAKLDALEHELQALRRELSAERQTAAGRPSPFTGAPAPRGQERAERPGSSPF
jgi:voltage-gated potassium channel